MAKGLTEKQRNILEFLISSQKENGFPPTIREIGEAFSIGSLRGVTVHLDALVRKGAITRGRTSRSIRILPPYSNPAGDGSVHLPIFAMGNRDKPVGKQALYGDLARSATPAGFVLRIGDHGVPGEPIAAKDLVLLRPQETPPALGQLIAVQDGDGYILCRATGDEGDAMAARVVGLIRRYD